MLKKYIEKIQKSLEKNEEKKGNKKIENTVTFIILLVIVVISINVIWKKDENQGTNFSNIITTSEEVTFHENQIYSNTDLEKKLTNILSEVEGAGKVSVMVSYSSTSEIVPLYNQNKSETVTEEDDGNGGKRTIKEDSEEKQIIYKEQSSLKEPVTSKITMPEITGVIVVCDGAGNPQVNASIVSAVEAVTGVASHKIQVLIRKAS